MMFSRVDAMRLLKAPAGSDIVWYPSRICSCVAENNGSPKKGHTCINGFYYGTPEATRVIYKSVSERVKMANPQLSQEGSCSITVFPEIRFNNVIQRPLLYSRAYKGDLIVITNQINRDRTFLLKGSQDTLYSMKVTEILSVSQDTTVFVNGTDYELESYIPSGMTDTFYRIKWLETAANVPDNDTRYSVEFMASLQYVIYDDLAKNRGSDNDELPRQITCKKRSVDFTLPVADLWDSVKDPTKA